MQKKKQKSEMEKNELISGIVGEIDLLKTNLISRIKDAPDGEIAYLAEFVRTKKAAEILNISLPTLYKYTKKGIIYRYRLGNKIYYRRDELCKALEKQFLNINQGEKL